MDNHADQVAKELQASQEFYERSTRVLEEADSDFRPKEGMMSAAQQIAHTAMTIEWFIEGASRPEGFDLDFAKHGQEMEKIKSLTEAKEKLRNAWETALAYVRSRSPEDFLRPLPPGPVMGGAPMGDIFWAMVEHTAHHRGALTVYSRLLGKVPPMPYGG